MYLIGSNYIKSYSNDCKEILDLFIPFQDVVSSSAGDYVVIGEKNGQTIYLISANEKVWENSIIGNINDVTYFGIC